MSKSTYKREYVAQAYRRGKGNHTVDVVRITETAVGFNGFTDVTFAATCDDCAWAETWATLDSAHGRGLRHSVGQGRED